MAPIARHEEHFTTAQPQAAATEAKSDSNGANKAVTPRNENFARARRGSRSPRQDTIASAPRLFPPLSKRRMTEA